MVLAGSLPCSPDEAVVSKEEPIVQEISDVLREWSVVWKRLYAVSDSAANCHAPIVLFSSLSNHGLCPLQEGRRRQFQELTQLMRDLLDRRRQILSKTLPRVSL